MENKIPLIIFTSGAVAKDVYQMISESCSEINKIYEFIGFVSSHFNEIDREVIDGKKVVTCDNQFEKFIEKYNKIAVVIPIANPIIKENIFRMIEKYDNIVYPNIIHDNAIVSDKFVEIGIGNIIAAGTILTHGIKLGNFNLLNVSVTIGHECILGDYNSINPQAVISGNVKIMGNVLVGTNSTILQEIEICKGATIGAGAVVTSNITQAETFVGIPARKINRS